MEKDLALALAKNMIGTDFDPENENMVLESVKKLNRIIADNAIEELNNLYSAQSPPAMQLI